MPRACYMSWNGRDNRWEKMFKGKRYSVSVSDLHGAFPSKEGSLKQANEWWKNKLAELVQPFALVEAEAGRRNVEVFTGVINQMDDESRQELVRMLYQRQANPQADVPPDEAIEAAVDGFLRILARSKKPKTYVEIVGTLAMLKMWWANLAVSKINEQHIRAAWEKVADMTVGQNTKKKHWGIIKRFVVHLAENKRIERPRNLNSKELVFRVSPQAIKTWPITVVRTSLKALPERFRLYALLGLNAGMTNVDIANLTKEMVDGGTLTRNRIKTAAHANCPVVCYRLWDETLALLEKHRSEHATLWLVSSRGTKLVDSRIESGKVKIKDLISQGWAAQKLKHLSPIPLFKFRNVAATLLESHPTYGRYVDYFLGHAPNTIKDKHYASPSPELFNQAMAWLREQIFPASSETR